MTLISLQTLTWTTVTGAVIGALLLASSSSAEAEKARPRRPGTLPQATPSAAAVPLSRHLDSKALLPVSQKSGDAVTR